jgi:hypothetical protein
MSHFTVLVIGDDYEAQLAPYNEEIEVEAYKDHLDEGMIERYHEMYEEDRGVRATGLGEILDWLRERYGDDDDRWGIDDDGLYRMSTYNPDSKWDWYTVGGRWRGYFKLKPEAMDDPDTVAQMGRPGAFDNEAKYDADHTLKKYIDIEGMRALAGDAAGKRWDQAQAVFGELPEALSWQQILAKHTPVEAVVPELAESEGGTAVMAVADTHIQSPPDVDAAREEYHAQPRVAAAHEHDSKCREEDRWDDMLLGWSTDVTQYQVTRESFVQDARDEAISTYAFVIEGKWYAKGEMGWFGMSTDGPKDHLRFVKEFNKMLDELPEDTLLTLVDCHI